MKCLTVVVVSIATSLVIEAPARAQSEKETLAEVPHDALGFVEVRNFERIDTPAKRLNLAFPFYPMAEIDRSRSEVVAFFSVAGEPRPIEVFFRPVFDYSRYVESYGAQDKSGKMAQNDRFWGMWYARKGDCAVEVRSGLSLSLMYSRTTRQAVTPADSRILEQVLAAKTSLVPSIEPLRSWRVENDISAVLTTRGIKALAATKAPVGPREAEDGLFPRLTELAVALEALGKACGTEISHVAAGASVDAAGNLVANMRIQAARGGDLSGALGISSGSERIWPVIRLQQAFFSPFAESERDRFLEKYMQAEKIKDIKDATPQIPVGNAKLVWFVGPFRKDKTAESTFAGLIKTENSEKFLKDNHVKALVLQRLLKESGMEPHWGVSKAQVAGFPALELTEISRGPRLGAFQKFMDVLAGARISYTFVALNGTTLLGCFGRAEDCAVLVKAFRSQKKEVAEQVFINMKDDLPASTVLRPGLMAAYFAGVTVEVFRDRHEIRAAVSAQHIDALAKASRGFLDAIPDLSNLGVRSR